MTRSGGCRAASASAWAPVAAVVTSYWRARRLIRSARTICGSSSTTRTRVIRPPAPSAAPAPPAPAGPRPPGTSVMVRPPPGVSSGSSVPPIASVSPRDRASPRPTPVVLSVSPSRWNAVKTASRSPAGIPGPRSTTRSSTRSPSALAVSRGGVPAGAYRSALPTRLAITRSSRPGSASTSGRSSGMSTRITRPRLAQVVQGPGGDVVEPGRPREHRQRAGLQPAHVEQVVDQPGEPVERLVRGGQQLGPVLGGPTARRWSAGWSPRPWPRRAGVRRSWLTAASSAVRIRSAAAIGRAAAASAASRCCSSAVAAWAAKAPSTRRSVGAQRAAAQRQQQRGR